MVKFKFQGARAVARKQGFCMDLLCSTKERVCGGVRAARTAHQLIKEKQLVLYHHSLVCSVTSFT